MMKPQVICHMMCSVDGRIITENWKKLIKTDAYEQVHKKFDSDAWMCGRVTMELDFADDADTDLDKFDGRIPREDHVADTKATSFAVAVDKDGKLRWKNADIDGDHLIEVLTENVPDTFLNYLQQKGISYIFAGKKEVDFELALKKLHKLFSIKKLMLEGGGHLNGSMLAAGLIDEVSILHIPIADGTAGAATVFEKSDKAGVSPKKLKLLEHKLLDNDILWLHYKVQQ